MSGSKKATVGYKYYLGQHLALCHGPVDSCMRIRFDKRVAWTGTSTGGRIDIDAQNLFGGKKREGGVSGAIDLLMGGPSQAQNDYLQAQLGTDIPAWRQVVSMVFRQFYFGMNYYLKAPDFRLQRIHTLGGGATQWYDAKAAILSSADLSRLAGKTVYLDFWTITYNQDPPDTAKVGIEFLDATGASIGGVHWSAEMADFVATKHTHSAVAPVGTAYVRVYFYLTMHFGPNNQAQIDALRLYTTTEEIQLINPSAETGDNSGWTHSLTNVMTGRPDGHASYH